MATSQEAIDAFNAAGTALPDIQNDTFSNPIEVDVICLSYHLETKAYQ